jgi:hypothetical protein
MTATALLFAGEVGSEVFGKPSRAKSLRSTIRAIVILPQEDDNGAIIGDLHEVEIFETWQALQQRQSFVGDGGAELVYRLGEVEMVDDGEHRTLLLLVDTCWLIECWILYTS